MRKICSVIIEVPKRIKARWVKLHKLKQWQRCRYDMSYTLKNSNVSAEEFKKRWGSLQRRLSNDELFALFKDSGFTPSDGNGRLAFVRKVFKQCKDTKVFLRVCICFGARSLCLFACFKRYVHLYSPHVKSSSFRNEPKNKKWPHLNSTFQSVS